MVGGYEADKEFEEILKLCVSHRIYIVDGDFGEPDQFSDHGPAGGGIDILHRIVWWEGLTPHELLHEVMHVFLAMPFLELAKQPNEYALLMPIERAYGKVMLTEQDYKDCVNWQEDTTISVIRGRGMELRDIQNYEHKRIWLRGKKIGRQLGVLDKNNKPTFNAPDWNALDKGNRNYLRAMV